MTPRELEMHLTDLFEGRLEGSALEDLQQELRTNPEARLAYRDHARLQNALQIRAEGHDPFGVIPMDLVVERRQRRYLRYAGIAAAAVLVLSGIVMLLIAIRTPPPLLTFTSSPGTTVSRSGVAGEDADEGAALEPGSRLEVLNGTVELNFGSGVRGIVRGPADLTLHAEDLLYLARGTAWFEVPPKAIGFRVNTPDLNLTDLGTEFGIRSRPEFLDEVHVFTGKVAVVNRYGLKTRETIVAGEARVAGPAGRWKEIPTRKEQFLTTLPRTEFGGFEDALIHDDFEQDSSGDYTCVDYHRSGGRRQAFHIDTEDSGVLEVMGNKTREKGAQVVHNSATLRVGQTFQVDWLTPAQSGYSISQVLTDSVEGLRYCVRLRVIDGAFDIDFHRGHTGSFTWINNSSYTAPETFWVERLSATEFAWFRGAKPSDRIKIADITFDANPGPLHVGVQAWATTARFDNLAIMRSPTGQDASAPPSPEAK